MIDVKKNIQLYKNVCKNLSSFRIGEQPAAKLG